MAIIKNASAGPRIFNVKGGGPNVVLQRTLAPGEAADLDLLVGVEQDKILQAMVQSKEIELAGPEALQAAPAFDPNKVMETQAKAEQAIAEARAARAQLAAAELDAERRTVPRQFGSDGGPMQVPTVDGRGGAMTPVQEQAGRQEPPVLAPAGAVETAAPAVVAAQQAAQKLKQGKA